MGFAKRILGAFVELDEKPKASAPEQEVIAKKIPKIMVGDLTTAPTVGGADPSLVQQFRQQFAKILADENTRNYPGNDYYEFITMKNAMAALAQEDIKYQAAFAGWMTGGNQTKDSLLKTANIYLGLVDREIKEFEEAYNLQHNDTVVKNESIITQKMREVQEMMVKITKLNNEIQQLKEENSAHSSALVSKHTAFIEAGTAQREEILSEIDKINKYIQ